MNVAVSDHVVLAESVQSPSRQILIAEDDRIFRHILQSWLQSWGYKVVVAEDGQKAWELLQHPNPPQLLILDWIMPGIDGLELCRRLREQQRLRYQYALLVTSKDEKQDVVRGLESGADDYLTKPFNTAELRARLRVGERILDLQDELIQAREDLRFRATHDALTGIWNRAAILDSLHRELKRAVRTKTPTGLLMVDLDHFKNINDTYGHLAGDLVLQEVAKRIVASVRAYDSVGRYGGEEFLAVLSGCTARDLYTSAERIRTAIAASPVLFEGREVSLTVSIGAVAALPGATAQQTLLAHADAALYRAKNSGRNRSELGEEVSPSTS